MTPDEYIEKFDRGFATVAVVDTNGLLRGQMVSSPASPTSSVTAWAWHRQRLLSTRQTSS